MFSVVGFDLDGTLFDDRQYVRAGLERAGAELEKITGEDLTEDLLAAYFDEGMTERTFDHVLEERDLPQRYVPRLVEAYHGNEASLVPFPDAEATLDNLRSAYDLAVITGGRNGEEKLQRLGLDGFVDTVVVTSDRADSKRDPGPFKTVLERFDAVPGEMVFVGDRPGLDFRQPNELGMGTIRVRRGRYATRTATEMSEPDATIDSLDDLPMTIRTIDQGASDSGLGWSRRK